MQLNIKPSYWFDSKVSFFIDKNARLKLLYPSYAKGICRNEIHQKKRTLWNVHKPEFVLVIIDVRIAFFQSLAVKQLIRQILVSSHVTEKP